GPAPMHPWDTLASLVGDLIVLTTAVINLTTARTRAQDNRRQPRQRRPDSKAITARYHAHHDTNRARSRPGHPRWPIRPVAASSPIRPAQAGRIGRTTAAR